MGGNIEVFGLLIAFAKSGEAVTQLFDKATSHGPESDNVSCAVPFLVSIT